MIYRKLIFAGFGSVLMFAAAFAGLARAEDTAQADSVMLKDIVGIVSIELKSGATPSFSVVEGTRQSAAVKSEMVGGVYRITGERPSEHVLHWWDRVNWRHMTTDNYTFANFLADEGYPRITIVMAPGTHLTLEEAAVHLTGGDIGGKLRIEGGLVEGRLGNVAAADIDIDRSGDLELADIAGLLDLSIRGSGDVKVRSIGEGRIDINGSGDVDMDEVKGRLDVDIYGSGDINARALAGTATVAIRGSGDVEIDGGTAQSLSVDINGSGDFTFRGHAKETDVRISGSGDVEIAEVSGRTKVNVSGQGDVDIDHGRAEPLNVRLDGHTDFRFGGVAVNPEIRLSRHSEASIASYEGNLDSSGEGELRIGH